MIIEIAMSVSGFLFLLILATLFASGALGNKIGDFDPDDRLQKISNNPRKYQISIVLSLIQYVSIIALAVMLFIVFSPYNLILVVVGTIFLMGEGLTQIYNEIKSKGLLKIAKQHSGSSGTEKNSLSDLARSILKTKNSRWMLATTLYGIGILAYSILFVTYGAVPAIIGWLGLVMSILLVLDSGIKLVKPNFKVLLTIGGLLSIPFEVILAGWLLFSPLI